MAELATQNAAATLPRTQNRVLKKFLANKSAVTGAVVVGIFVLIALLALDCAIRSGKSEFPCRA